MLKKVDVSKFSQRSTHNSTRPTTFVSPKQLTENLPMRIPEKLPPMRLQTPPKTSLMDERVDIRVPKFHVNGKVKAIGVTVLGLTAVGLIVLGVSSKNKKKVANNKSVNTINEGHEKATDTVRVNTAASQNKMAVDTNRTDNEIRKAQAQSKIRMDELKQRMEMSALRRTMLAQTASTNAKALSMREWIENFRKDHEFPDLTNFQILPDILKGTPDGYEDAMLVHLLSMFGGLCFSRVRAKISDMTIQAPNIQTVIVGESGSGKGKFKQVYSQLFKRIIDSDRKKMGLDGKQIIQMVGLQVSNAKFFEILAYNEGVHMYSMEEELQEIADIFGKNGKLDYNILRKAFDNGDVFKDNMTKRGVKGSFPVFYNYTFTGTPGALKSFFPEKEREGGTARRHIIASIPELGLFPAMLILPEGDKLEEIRDQIDDWREKYCFTTDTDGEEVPCPEHHIDLHYLFDALDEWAEDQRIMADTGGEPERKAMSNAIEALAFHCAMVLHMLAGEPDSSERAKRRAVKEATLYLADYCMERYITLFGKPVLEITANSEPEEFVMDVAGVHNEDRSIIGPVARKLTDEEIQKWYPLHGTLDADGKVIGYGYIANKLNVDKDSVRNSLKRYEKMMAKQ